VDEAELIARIEKSLARRGLATGNGVITGIGDDCAIFRPRSGDDLLFTTDQMHQDRHFTAATPPRHVGHTALARSLSDIAAMGGRPLFTIVALASDDPAWIDQFYAGLLALAEKHHVILAGGDLSSTPTPSCDVMVCGAVPRGQALLRSKAKPGDTLYVSGPLGAAALALAKGASRLPVPQLALGQTLYAQGVRCAMDLSDGLSIDLRRLCLASGVSAHLDTVPRARGASLHQALHGGEDYALLFTSRKPIPQAIAIGRIAKSDPGEVFYDNKPLPPLGWDHYHEPRS
jgi:thiamine-monophosphate kinase